MDRIMSRLSNITTDGESTANAAYTYLGAGTIASETYPVPQVSLDYSANNFAALDRFGRVQDQAWKKSGQSLDEYTYLYDAAGNRTQRANAVDALLSEGYQYDSLNRLKQWSINGVQQNTWSLDALGNDTSAGTYNASNEETPNSGSSGYDAAGNMTTLTSGKTAVYDAWNRLVEVDNSSTVVEKCEYDGTNRRIRIYTNFSGGTPPTAADVQDDYYVGQQVVESRKTTGYNLTTKSGTAAGGYQYVWSPRYIDAAVLRDTLNTSGTGILAASRVFYLADANYNVTALVNSSGQVLERYTYTPYGVVTYRNADWSVAGSSANHNTILYTGRELEAAISASMYFYRARLYDAGLQRFISRDPARADFDLYRYCLSNPSALVDPYGMYTVEVEHTSTGDARNQVSHIMKLNEGKGAFVVATTFEMGAEGVAASATLVHFKTVADIVKELKAVKQKNGIGTAVLEIYGHGNPDGLYFASSAGGGIDVNNASTVGQQLKPYLACPSMIILHGCNTGNSKERPSVLTALAVAAEAKVLGYGGFASGYSFSGSNAVS